MAGRCTHCGRRDTGRESGIPEELAARLAARQGQLTSVGRAQARRARQMVVRSRWRAAPAARRWLPWLAASGLLALAAWYAVASGFFAPAVPLSWSTGCDICGVYIAEHGAGCERFFIDSDQADRARSVNTCAVDASTRAGPAGHSHHVHRLDDGSFRLAPAAAGSDSGPVTFTQVPGAADRWRSDSPAPFGGSARGLFRRTVADEAPKAQGASPAARPAATAKWP